MKHSLQRRKLLLGYVSESDDGHQHVQEAVKLITDTYNSISGEKRKHGVRFLERYWHACATEEYFLQAIHEFGNPSNDIPVTTHTRKKYRSEIPTKTRPPKEQKPSSTSSLPETLKAPFEGIKATKERKRLNKTGRPRKDQRRDSSYTKSDKDPEAFEAQYQWSWWTTLPWSKSRQFQEKLPQHPNMCKKTSRMYS